MCLMGSVLLTNHCRHRYMTIVVIGKNSFLASHLQTMSGLNDWLFLSHDEALKNFEWMVGAKIIFNFAMHPDMKSGPYLRQNDIDLAIAEQIENKDIYYVMMSSRTVYGSASPDLYFCEEMLPNPKSYYGQNKWIIEQALAKVLNSSRLTILRMGNIFGFEQGRDSFFGVLLDTLARENLIRFDIAPDSQRDFLSIWRWAEYTLQIARNVKSGVYNIGAGFGVSPLELVDWIFEDRNHKNVVFTNHSYDGQFILDMSKSWDAFGLQPYTKIDLKTDVKRILAAMR